MRKRRGRKRILMMAVVQSELEKVRLVQSGRRPIIREERLRPF